MHSPSQLIAASGSIFAVQSSQCLSSPGVKRQLHNLLLVAADTIFLAGVRFSAIIITDCVADWNGVLPTPA